MFIVNITVIQECHAEKWKHAIWRHIRQPFMTRRTQFAGRIRLSAIKLRITGATAPKSKKKFDL
jgi:hypothetical protein